MTEKKTIEFTYEKIKYSGDKNLLTQYLRIGNDKKIGLYIKGQESPYLIVDTDSDTIVFNSQIDRATFGVGAEATRIKICSALNTAYDLFVIQQGWYFTESALGLIVCKDSALDNRKKSGVDIAALFKKATDTADSDSDTDTADTDII